MTKKHVFWVIGIIIGCSLIALGYLLIQYLLDRYNYHQAYTAYQEVRCNEAIGSYNALINSWRLFDPGDYLADAKVERNECRKFQEADNQIYAGNYSAALWSHYQFLTNRPKSHLAAVSQKRITLLVSSIYPDQFVSLDNCSEIDQFVEAQLIPNPELVLPPFYHYCGVLYAEAGEDQAALEHQQHLLIGYPDHELALASEAALLSNPRACQEIEALAAQPVIAARPDFMPALYYTCGQAYDAENQFELALAMYTALLTLFPDHPLAEAAEESLFSYEAACNYLDTREDNSEFKPRLYYQCGLYHQNQQNYAAAIQMYEKFRVEYPEDDLATAVEAALADAIVAQARGQEAGQIPRPERSGASEQDAAVVVIQNDSPQRLRIIFSGPESRIEELIACATCENYSFIGPLDCPQKGPIGSYELIPGDYEVVVEASSDRGVIPFKGSWDLRSGDEYSSCFYIVEQWFP